jgi:hypothetical protein
VRTIDTRDLDIASSDGGLFSLLPFYGLPRLGDATDELNKAVAVALRGYS